MIYSNELLMKLKVKEAVAKHFGSDIKITMICFPFREECLIRTNKKSLKFLHGEYTSFLSEEKSWMFDEYSSEDFKSTKEFFRAYGY